MEEYPEQVNDEGRVFELSNLAEGPSRSEKLFGSEWKKKVLNKSDLPYPEVMYIHCPRHANILMTPIKIFRSGYGYSLLFQCHYIDEHGTACLITNQVYEALNTKHWLRPGDILDFEADWMQVLDKIQEVNSKDTVKKSGDSTTQESLLLTEAPPNPWNKPLSTAYIIWDIFWDKIVEKGECTFDELEEEYKQRKGVVDKQFKDYSTGSQPLEEWMYHRTGFIIKKYGYAWRLIGRGAGKEDREPWKNSGYQEKFGFN